MDELTTWPMEIAKGVINIKKNVLYFILVLAILGVFSSAQLLNLDYSMDTKVFHNDVNRARSSETVGFSDNSLDEDLFADQYTDLAP